MITTLLIFAVSLAVAIYARKKAGGHLTKFDHSMTTIEPTYWLTRKQQEARELWRVIGVISMWLAVASAAVTVIRVIGGFHG